MAHEVYPMKNHDIKMIPFKLLYVTHSEYDKGWHSTPHSHHFTELFYIVNGKGSFILPQREIPVQQNDLVIINPNIEHTEKSNQQDSMEYIALGIQGLAFSLPDDQDTQIGLFTYQGERDDILFYLKILLQEIHSTNENFEMICRNIIEILIIKLQRAKKVTIESHEPKSLNQSVVLVKHYIKQNFHDSITLDVLANVGNINKYYLVHIFKQELGMSPIEYLIHVRIKEAKILLETTNYTIAQIGNFSGFSSQSFFSQAFKRETQETPSQYRKRVQIMEEE